MSGFCGLEPPFSKVKDVRPTPKSCEVAKSFREVHLPCPLQSLGHAFRSQAAPVNPSTHTQAPWALSQWPRFEHSTSK